MIADAATGQGPGPEFRAGAFRAAWEARDHLALAALLAPEVTLSSPILSAPFRGRDEVEALYEVLFARLPIVAFTDLLVGDETEQLHWSAEIHRRRLQGIDVLRFDEDGRIAEITVFIRPLTGIAAFMRLVGPELASRQGTFQRLAVTAAGPFFFAYAAVSDRISAALLGLGGKEGSA